MMELFMRIFNKFFLCYKIYTFKINTKLLNIKTIVFETDFEIKILTIEDIDSFDYVEKYRKGYKHIAFNRLSNQNYICLGLFDNTSNRLAYFNWIKKHEHFLHEINTQLNLKTNEALLLDDYTLPGYRGCGLHSYMMNERLKYCQQIGLNSVHVLIMCFNQKAIQTIQKYKPEIDKSFFSIRRISNDRNR